MDTLIKFYYTKNLTATDIFAIQNLLTAYAKKQFTLRVKKPNIYIHVENIVFSESGKSELDLIQRIVKLAASRSLDLAYMDTVKN